jgi:hypothetical protein
VLGTGENLHVFGRVALLRGPKIQGRAAALPYQVGDDFVHAPIFAFPKLFSRHP